MSQGEFRHRLRISKTDIDGNAPLEFALQEIKGIGKAMAKAIVRVAKLDGQMRAGYLTDEDVKKIEEILKDPAKYGIPTWMFNRKRDPYSGEDRHLIESDWIFTVQQDIALMKKIRCYRGIRHELGLPCRGQRTRSTFRRGPTVGVSRKKK